MSWGKITYCPVHNFTRDMNDGHLWFSVAGRPARSPFTRVQRLSCCLTLLYSTMLTNIMFFGRGDDFDPPEPLKIAGLEIKPPISLPQVNSSHLAPFHFFSAGNAFHLIAVFTEFDGKGRTPS